MKLIIKLDAGGHVHNQHKVNEIVDTIRSEFPEVEISGIRGLLRIAGRKSCHVSHFRVEEQILKTVCLVNIETVNAELFKSDYIVLTGAVLQLAESCFQALFCSLQRLDCEAFRTACLVCSFIMLL